MQRKKILALYNFNWQDEQVLSYLLEQYLDQKSVRITLLHIYAPLQKYTQISKGADEGLSFKGAGRRTGTRTPEFRKKEDELQKIRTSLLEEGFDPEQITIDYRPKENTMAKDIVDIVKNEKYTTVILSHVPNKTRYFLTERVEDKLLNNLKKTEIIFLT